MKSHAIDAVEKYLKENDWKFQKVELEKSLCFLAAFEGKNGTYQIYWNCKYEEEHESYLSIMVLFPIKIVDEKRLSIAEFLTRANYNMIHGNFEMDMDDGDVRFRTSIPVKHFELPYETVGFLTSLSIMTMDNYCLGIHELLYSDKSPKGIIEKIESNLMGNSVNDSSEETAT